MGIAFSHCDAQWSYGGFNAFRVKLAKEVGIDLDSMDGFDGCVPWSKFSDDIIPLLDHSDCDGELTPNLCASIAKRLRELVEGWPESHDRANAILLAKGMEAAFERGEPLEFC